MPTQAKPKVDSTEISNPVIPSDVETETNNSSKIFNILTDPDKKLLTKRIFEIIFLDEVNDEFRCIQCGQVAISHHISKCNHIFCYHCKDVYTICGERVWSCPECRILDKDMTKRDPGLELKVLVLRITCPNRAKGCTFHSTLLEMPGHIRECDRTIDLDHKKILQDAVKEPNAFKQYLEAKMNRLENRFIHLQETMTVILSHEFKKLNKAIESQDVNFDDHLRVIDEAFRDINERLGLSEYEAINSENDPLKEIEKNVRRLQLSFFQNNFNNDFRPLKCMIPPTSTVFTWVINEVSDSLLAEDAEHFETVNFLLNGQPILLQTEFRFPNGYVSSQFRNPLDGSLSDWLVPPYPRVTYTMCVLKNKKKEKKMELEKEAKTSAETEETEKEIKPGTSAETGEVELEIKPGTSAETGQVELDNKAGTSTEPEEMAENLSIEEIVHVTEIAYKEQREKLQQDWYSCSFGTEMVKKSVQNNSLTISICVDFTHLLDKPTSMSGMLCWKLNNFTESIKKAKGKRDICYSPYFYTGERGFRMQAELNKAYMSNLSTLPNAYLQPIPLTVRCLTGEFDASLPDDFELAVTVGIVDRKGTVIPTSREVSRNAICELNLLTLEQLHVYLKDDALEILISVVGYEFS